MKLLYIHLFLTILLLSTSCSNKKPYPTAIQQADSCKILSEIEAQRNSLHLAFDSANKSLTLEDSITTRTQRDAIGKINALYNYHQTEKKNQQLLQDSKQKQYQIFLLIVGLLLIRKGIALYIDYVRKQKQLALAQRQRLLQLKDEKYKNSNSYIEENATKIAALEVLLKQAEGNTFALKQQLILSQKELLEVSNQKIQKVQNEKELLELSLQRSDIYQLFHHRQDTDSAITKEHWELLRQIIDTTYNNFTKKIYALYPQISEQELYMCYLIKISIPVRVMAQILNRTASAITNARVRLYKKIHGEEGKADMLDRFIIDL